MNFAVICSEKEVENKEKTTITNNENSSENAKKASVWFYASNVAVLLLSVFFEIESKTVLKKLLFVAIGASVLIFALTLFFALKKRNVMKSLSNQAISRLLFIVAIVVCFITLITFFFEKKGILEKTDTVDEMRDYIRQFKYAKWAYVAIQFGQVIFLPIPTTVTILAGLLLFKPWEVVLYSMIGIMPGSVIMFLFGRFAGRKAVNWAFGEEEVEKYLNLIKGKDVSVLTFMFVMPFFPDDTLCAIAGLSTMKFWYFVPVIFVARIIMCIGNVFLFGSGLIPFKGWGIPVWILLVALCITALVFVWKKGDVIEKKVVEFFSRNKKHENDN